MTLMQAAKKAVADHSTLLDAQAWICETQFRLCPVATFKECLRAVELEWANQKPVGWPSYPQRHEVLGPREFHNEVLGVFVAPDDEESR